jgi:hypothetical protein
MHRLISETKLETHWVSTALWMWCGVFTPVEFISKLGGLQGVKTQLPSEHLDERVVGFRVDTSVKEESWSGRQDGVEDGMG